MIENKITIELIVPNVEEGDNLQEIQSLITSQTRYLVDTWRAILAPYRKNNIIIPTLSMRMPARISTSIEPNETKINISKNLLDYHLKRVPNANIPPQIRAIKQLLELVHPDTLLEMYDESVKSYPMTSWLTVKYKYNKPSEPAPKSEMGFERVELDENKIADLKARLKK